MNFGFVLSDLSGGGAEKAVLNIANGLLNLGNSVHIFILKKGGDYKIPSEIGVSFLSDNSSFSWIGKRLLARCLSTEVSKFEKCNKFDAIISTLPLADEVSVLANLPNHYCRIANTLSIEIQTLLRGNNARKARRRFQRYQNMYRDRNLIAVSEGVKTDLESYFGFNQSRIRVIYNPFDFDSIRKDSKENIDVPKEKYIIHVGRFSEQKRHDLLFDAYQSVSKFYKLVLLTNSHPDLTSMISERGLDGRVIIAGFQKNPYPWMLHAKLLVLSSDYEGMPNVIIESLIVGTPVVSTDCPSGPREVLGKFMPCSLSPVGDSEALARAICSTLEKELDYDVIDLGMYRANINIAKYEKLAKGVV